MASKLYEMKIIVSIKVEADDTREARRECTLLANEVIARMGELPVGCSLVAGPNTSPVNLI